MALGYSGVVTQARAQKASLVSEQRSLRMEEQKEKREIQAEIKKLQGMASAVQTQGNDSKVANSTKSALRGVALTMTSKVLTGGALSGDALNQALTAQQNNNIDKATNATISTLESKINALQDKYTTNSNNRQMRLDEIEQEITACDEQIKDAKKQGGEATKEMFGANG